MRIVDVISENDVPTSTEEIVLSKILQDRIEKLSNISINEEKKE